MNNKKIVAQGFDIIGDIHGYVDALKRLLSTLGYQEINGVWGHPKRKAIFVGDLVDRGTKQKELCELVRKMVDAGQAELSIGNHEFNAVGYATAKGDGTYLRKHSSTNTKHHQAFLDCYPFHSAEHLEMIEWFKNRPLWLELETLSGQPARVIHAYWHNEKLELLKKYLHHNGQAWVMGTDFDQRFYHSDEEAFDLIELLLKGPEVDLPQGASYFDSGQKERKRSRVNWWTKGKTWRESCILGGFKVNGLDLDEPFNALPCKIYDDEIPIFFGHYWMNGELAVQTSKVACLDWSIAKKGRLVAYRWDGEQDLSVNKMVAVQWSVELDEH